MKRVFLIAVLSAIAGGLTAYGVVNSMFSDNASVVTSTGDSGM